MKRQKTSELYFFVASLFFVCLIMLLSTSCGRKEPLKEISPQFLIQIDTKEVQNQNEEQIVEEVEIEVEVLTIPTLPAQTVNPEYEEPKEIERFEYATENARSASASNTD